nr:NEL-type E3 ubiquitin ligase domain-containing protein [uncultured Pseudomonas sp.]
MADLSSGTPPAATQSIHREYLERSSPAWLVDATSSRREQLKTTPTAPPDWYLRASPEQQKALNDKYTTSLTTQTALDKAFAALQDIDTFAQPLLVKALLDTFNVQLDVHKTLLQLRTRVEYLQPQVTYGTFEVVRLPLLQAALHNFEDWECKEGAFDASSGFVTETSEAQKFEAVSTSLTVAQFTGLCRSLDIGAQYQRYLNDFMHPKGAVAEQALRHKFGAARKADLAAAAQQALLTQDIGPDDYQMIVSVINGENHPWMGTRQVWFRDLSLMKKRMIGCVVFVICEIRRYTNDLILYIPHDPHHPLKRVTYQQMQAIFKARFTTRDTSAPDDGRPTAYQHFFSRFVRYGDLPTYFGELAEFTPAPGTITGLKVYSPFMMHFLKGLDPFSLLFKTTEVPPNPEPIRRFNPNPFLDATTMHQKGRSGWEDNLDLWNYLFDQHRDKLLADARSHAVPTADVDARVRSEKFAKLLGIGLLALNVVSLFVPVLGEVMMTVMAGQLLYETLEGSIEWAEGDRRAAKAHLVDVAENLAFIAVLAGLGKGFSKVVAVKPEPVIEDLQPVTLDNGDEKLWRPDLAPYKAPITLPADARPNALGLYTHDGQTVLSLDSDHFQLRHDPLNDEYRIQHPTRPHAYAPRLAHNLEGAWQHEAESPLSWDTSTLISRLGLPAEGMSAERVQAALEASDVEPDTLRAEALDNHPIPLVLADTLQRFRGADDVSAFIAQIKAADAGEYAKADVVLQMDLLQRRGMLGDTRLRVLDAYNNLLWEDAAPSSVKPRVVALSAQAMSRGELLQEVLRTLQGVDPALTEFPGRASDALPERARLLRQDLGEYAETHRNTLVQERYRKQDFSNNPDVNRLRSTYPTLPTPVAEHLLRNLTDEQRLVFRTGKRLPDEVQAQAQWHAQEIRVSRAYEGLHVDALAKPDSHILALRTLETLSGWRRGTRVELREYSATGRALDAIGSPDALIQKQLVLREDGLFDGSPPGDFYSALWQQLSAEERQALTATDAAHLQALIRRSPLPRGLMRTVLLEHPLQKPEYDPSMRLLGGAFSVRQVLTRAFSTPAERTRKLFPTYTEAQTRDFLAAHGNDATRELTRLEKEYKKLEKDLAAWVKDQTLSNATLFDRRGGARKVVSDAIVACWRRQTRTLKIGAGSQINLPELTADFTHVQSLELFNVSWTTGAQNFLGRFKQLKQLKIQNAMLTELPDGLGEMENLTHLTLSRNSIRLTPASVEQLGNLSQLEVLDLMGNPLQLPPDLSRMPHLKAVDLSFTRLNQWPTGLLEQENLERLDLSHNALSRIPAEHLHPAPEHFEKIIRINHTIDLRSNAFLADTGLELDRYWQRVSQHHPGFMHLRDSNYFALESLDTQDVQGVFPRFSLGRAREYWLSLGDGAPAELNRLKVELQRLNQQLDAWASTGGGGGRQRYVRMRDALLVGDRGGDRFTAKSRILECWRKQAPEEYARDGTPIGQVLNLSSLQLQSLPALDADFSHVGSLVLKNLNLSTSPEEFLSHFRGLRWLDMSENRLHELPPALGQMDGLTRLDLSNNQIRLTADTARMLSERTSLRALAINKNPLGVNLDFTQIRDMRSLNMSDTGIDHWPVGLGEQPLLDAVALNNNLLTTLPDFVIPPAQAPLEGSLPLRCRVIVGNNPLTPATAQRISDYRVRVEQAGLGGNPNVGILTPMDRLVLVPGSRSTNGAHFTRWSQGFSTEQTTTRQAQWSSLRTQPNGDGFFTMLNDMQAPDGGHADLQRRVWNVLDSISEHSVESEALRDEMFTWAGRGTCCDRAALSFSNVEIMSMVYRAKAAATDANQGPALQKLARGLFRLDEVEKTALQDIEQRTAQINNDASLSAAEKRRRIVQLEEVEVRLAYRYGLKGPEKLDLPGQPDKVTFIGMGKVTPKQLTDTLERIRKLDGSPQEFAALLTRDFWKDFVVSKYRPQFEELSEPYYEELAKLTDASTAGELSEGDFLSKSNDLKARLAAAEEGLIESLSRTEWEVPSTTSK